MTSEDFSEVYWYSGLQALFVTIFQTSVDFLCKTSYKSSSLLGYFDCFQSNHINFSDLSQIRREKFCFASNVSTFLLYIFARLQLFRRRLQRLANFSPCDPLIFCFSPTRYAHLVEKRIFFEHSWVIFERGTEKENFFRLMRFPNEEAKSYFLHCSAL